MTSLFLVRLILNVQIADSLGWQKEILEVGQGRGKIGLHMCSHFLQADVVAMVLCCVVM